MNFLRVNQFGHDPRSASEVLGLALLIGLVMVAISIILLVAVGPLASGQEAVEVEHAEDALTQFDSVAAAVATDGNGSRAIDLGLRANSGTIAVDPDQGSITIEYVDGIDNATRTELVNDSLGTLTYEHGDATVAYQGGGVWRAGDGPGSTMVSPPEISLAGGTLTMALIYTEHAGSIHSDVRVRTADQTMQAFPDYESDGLDNTIDRGTVRITIESRYYRAWGRFFEDRTDTDVIYSSGAGQNGGGGGGGGGGSYVGSVTVIFYGAAMNFSPEAGVIATSGPGEIRVEGSGSYIDSYNSSIGPYEDTQFEEGTVKSAGNVSMFGGSEILGDVDSNAEIALSGGSLVTGNASAIDGWSTDGTSEIQGETDYDANVPDLTPIDSYIGTVAEQLRYENDNDAVGAIDDDDALSFDGGTAELSPGEYYLEAIDLQDEETLVVNATAGDVDIVVEEYIRLDEGTIEVAGESDDGIVRVFVVADGSSGVTVPGSGGFTADHFYVDGDSEVAVTDQASRRFQVLGPAHFRGAIRASAADDPQVTASIFAPASDEGPGEFLVRDGELFGAVVTGNVTAENNAEIHFDHALTAIEIPFGEGASLLDFLYIDEYSIEVEDARK